MDKYLNHLQEELEKAVNNFEKAKQEAAAEILKMSVHIAEDYGAGYAAHVERITKEASKICTIHEQIRAYEYFSKN